MRVYYENEDNKTFCFRHAVLAVLKDNEVIYTIVEDTSDDPYDSVVGFSPPCDECSQEEEEDNILSIGKIVNDDQMKQSDDLPEEPEIDYIPF